MAGLGNHDPRAEGARFYDLQQFPDDVPFYRSLLPHPDAHVLELGAGTGRVAVELAEHCGSIHGIELSRAMLAFARQKRASLPEDLSSRVSFGRGDISSFDLGRRFDLVIAPYRVFQALERDRQVAGCLDAVRAHLAPEGTCILTMFNPLHPPDTLRANWVREDETVEWEREIDGERIVASDRRPAMDRERLVLYPELIFRRYRGTELLDEVVMPIVMRCWYPEQIESLLEGQGFEIVNRWGGYRGEAFGDGSELVVQFRDAST